MRYGRPRRGARGIALGAEHELRVRQDALQRQLDAGVEAALRAARLVEREQRRHVGVGDRTPIGAARQRREDLPRTGRLGRGGRAGGRTAGEDAAAARRVARPVR